MSDSKLVSTVATTANSDRGVQDPEVRREAPMRDFLEDEKDIIAKMFRLVGNRWHLIAGRIPGRTAEEIEKYWTTSSSSGGAA